MEYSALTKDLGEKIAGLNLKQAKELSDYLKDVHGIEPAAGGAVMVAAGAGLNADAVHFHVSCVRRAGETSTRSGVSACVAM